MAQLYTLLINTLIRGSMTSTDIARHNVLIVVEAVCGHMVSITDVRALKPHEDVRRRFHGFSASTVNGLVQPCLSTSRHGVGITG